MDRIDIIQKVKPVNYFELANEKNSKSSKELGNFVQKAREVQEIRFSGIKGISCNAQMNAAMIQDYCRIDIESVEVLKQAFDKYRLSARTYNRLLRIARTYADLEQVEDIRKKDVINALIARGLIL
jgi:magnesium chelatase family protein